MSKLKKLFLALTKHERILFFSAAATALVSGIVLSGLVLAEHSRVIPASGGEYVEGFLEQPAYVNPVIASTAVDRSLVKLIFSNIPGLAEKIDSSPDGRIWNVRIKEDLTWHDGEKLTTDDIVFTIQKIQDPESASPLAKSWRGVSVKRVSELEVQLSLINPDPTFRDTLGALYVIPKHLFAEVPPSNWRLSDYNLKPIGSGPYQFISYDKRADGFISFYRLGAWGGYAGTKPLISNFDFAFFSNLEALVKDFNSGKVDGVAGLEPDGLLLIARPHETFSLYLPSYYAVFFNQSKSVQLKDPVVRQVLGAVVNRDDLVKTILHGYGTPALGPIPIGTPYFDPTLASTTASLDSASSSLDRAGWKMGGDGVRVKTIGTSQIRLELTLTVPQIGFLLTTADELSKTWTALGFKITTNALGLDEITNDTIKNRDYDMLLFGNVLNTTFDLAPFWHSSQRFYPGLNLALYNNKKADSLMDSLPQGASDDQRTNQLHALQKAIAGDSPAVFLYSLEYAYITTKDLRGVESGFIADPSDRFLNVAQWYIRTARVLN